VRRLPALLVFLAASASAACMDHRRHVESIPRGRLVQVGPPLRSSFRAYAVLWPTPDGLVAEARVQTSCPTRELTLVHDIQVTEITAASSRWYAAVPCFAAGGALLAFSEGHEIYALSAMGAGFAVAALPSVAERTKREHLAWREQQTPGVPVRCADRPLSEVTLTLRTGTGTREAVTDLQGRVRFVGVTPSEVRVAYIDGTAVPIHRPNVTPPPR